MPSRQPPGRGGGGDYLMVNLMSEWVAVLKDDVRGGHLPCNQHTLWGQEQAQEQWH